MLLLRIITLVIIHNIQYGLDNMEVETISLKTIVLKILDKHQDHMPLLVSLTQLIVKILILVLEIILLIMDICYLE